MLFPRRSAIYTVLILITVLWSRSASFAAEAAPKRTPAKPSETERIRKLEQQFEFLKRRLNRIHIEEAEVATDNTSIHSIARTKHGAFIVSHRGLTPYLDGFKLTLAIGNPTTVTFSGAQISVSWGLPYDENGIDDAWMKSQRSKEFSVTDKFSPGEYTYVEVVLAPAKPEEVRTVRVGLTFNRLSLRTPER